MDIEKLKQELLIEAETLANEIKSYCSKRFCGKCDFFNEGKSCTKNRLFVAMCDAYALFSNNKTIVLEIDKMIKVLYPNFYIHLTKRELEP